jgi:hypothetical protein
MLVTIVKRVVTLILTAASLCFSRAADKGLTDALVAQADAIVVGEIVSGQQSGSNVALSLSVARVSKGTAQVGTMINVQWSNAWPNRNTSFSGLYGMWFLKQSQLTWNLIPVAQGQVALETSYFRLPEGSGPTTSASAAIDIVALELASGIESYTDPEQLSSLGYADTPTVVGIYQTLSNSPDPEIRFIGLTGQLRAPNPSILQAISANVGVLAGLKTAAIPLGAIQSVRDSSSTTVQCLGAITSSPATSLQRAAVYPLAMIHTLQALPFLATLLGSTDSTTRDLAIRGLSMFVDNLPIVTLNSVPNQAWRQPQGPTPYKTPDTDRYSLSQGSIDPAQEAAYVQFWQSWWANMKSQLAP